MSSRRSFVSYGEAYWNDQHNQNANFSGTRFEPQKMIKKNDTEKQVCGDTKYNHNKDDTNATNDMMIMISTTTMN